jgi:hypothetical protein
MTGQHHHIHGGGFCRACIVYGARLGAEETLRAVQEAAKGDAALADAESGPDQRGGETKPAGEGLCTCETPSDYLIGDVDGWRCEVCSGRVWVPAGKENG